MTVAIRDSRLSIDDQVIDLTATGVDLVLAERELADRLDRAATVDELEEKLDTLKVELEEAKEELTAAVDERLEVAKQLSKTEDELKKLRDGLPPKSAVDDASIAAARVAVVRAEQKAAAARRRAATLETVLAEARAAAQAERESLIRQLEQAVGRARLLEGQIAMAARSLPTAAASTPDSGAAAFSR